MVGRPDVHSVHTLNVVTMFRSLKAVAKKIRKCSKFYFFTQLKFWYYKMNIKFMLNTKFAYLKLCPITIKIHR